jgi:hypothetical protein
MRRTKKMERAARTLQRRYLQERRQLRQTGNYQPLSCVVKLDRLVLTANEVPLQALASVPGYRAKKPQRLWKQLYSIAIRISGTDSLREVIVESAPNLRWLPRFRIVIVPRDESGLRVDDLRSILELLPKFRFVLAEIAVDFPIKSLIDPVFVRRHLLLGKTWMRGGSNKLYERYGSAGSRKIVRCYVKFEAATLRIELQLHARFLRHHSITHTSDFAKLATILPTHHIYFAALDSTKLRKNLLRTVPSPARRNDILQAVGARKSNLWATLRYLRNGAKLTNVRRLLTPLASINNMVSAALAAWAAQWPSRANQLNPGAHEGQISNHGEKE